MSDVQAFSWSRLFQRREVETFVLASVTSRRKGAGRQMVGSRVPTFYPMPVRLASPSAPTSESFGKPFVIENRNYLNIPSLCAVMGHSVTHKWPLSHYRRQTGLFDNLREIELRVNFTEVSSSLRLSRTHGRDPKSVGGRCLCWR
jgi:hypothetical protein